MQHIKPLLLLISLLFFFTGCQEATEVPVFITVLGLAQDAGYPQANCQKSCCKPLLDQEITGAKVVCLGLSDRINQQHWMFEATPDFKFQLQSLLQGSFESPLSGIFLTHAHMGHYTGLIHLGREAMGANKIPVHTLPKMKRFLESFGPWGQLVNLQNIDLHPLQVDSTIRLNNQITVTPFQVPHRDEYSETAGFKITGPSHSALFIPDIDKWEKWDKDIIAAIKSVDYAFLDGTFFKNGEIPNRDMSEIPHPFVEESLLLFKNLSPGEKRKVYFTHFNHTNPLLQIDSPEQKSLQQAGFPLIKEGQVFPL